LEGWSSTIELHPRTCGTMRNPFPAVNWLEN
jgi:hypothetical protein